MPASVDIQGVQELTEKIEQMGLKTNKVISPILKTASQPILDDIKNTTAFKDKSGRLRKSFKISNVTTINGAKTVWVGDVDGVAKYGWYVEFGHSDKSGSAPAHPFMRPANQNHADEVMELIKQGLQEALEDNK